MCGLTTPKEILAAAPSELSVRLLEQIDHFVCACTESLHQVAIEELLPDVLRALHHRFAQEERLIGMLEQPGDRALGEMHLVQHQNLRDQLTNLQEMCRRDDQEFVVDRIVHFFQHTLPMHFSTSDRDLAQRALAQAL